MNALLQAMPLVGSLRGAPSASGYRTTAPPRPLVRIRRPLGTIRLPSRGVDTELEPSTGIVEGLVSVCAWCPPESYQPLKINEAYTHGICPRHKREMLAEIGRT